MIHKNRVNRLSILDPESTYKMPSFTSLPTELTTKILRIYVAFYIDPSFDITHVPLNDSSALKLQHLSN
ncbi:hypothetical protein BDP27DRAFT_1420760 [Rhodocollybia butyracea]|uniref:Uncharacterized protein n=1 Tax=Rhodocollybia butyracea TaxID=206335 RepID=A0A9P5PUZ3_9AGAR|nr:hypothetical protein BDP27DRAFT_1420760 [Rhodocollybia butyracea]